MAAACVPRFFLIHELSGGFVAFCYCYFLVPPLSGLRASGPGVAMVVTEQLNAGVYYRRLSSHAFAAAPFSHGQDTYRFWEAVALGAVPVTLRGPLDGLYSQVPSVLVDGWRITAADLVAWRQNLTERFGDLDAATRTARRTVLNSTFWAEQIRAMA